MIKRKSFSEYKEMYDYALSKRSNCSSTESEQYQYWTDIMRSIDDFRLLYIEDAIENKSPEVMNDEKLNKSREKWKALLNEEINSEKRKKQELMKASKGG